MGQHTLIVCRVHLSNLAQCDNTQVEQGDAPGLALAQQQCCSVCNFSTCSCTVTCYTCWCARQFVRAQLCIVFTLKPLHPQLSGALPLRQQSEGQSRARAAAIDLLT